VKRIVIQLLMIGLLPGCAGADRNETPSEAAHDITFWLEDATARSVEVAGSFNNWQPNSTPMRKKDAGKWSVTVKLLPGRYQYMFVIDGNEWVTDPKAAPTLPDGFGRANSLVVIE